METSKKSPVMAVSSSNNVPVISSSCNSSALTLFPNIHIPLWTKNATPDPVDLSHRYHHHSQDYHPPSPPASSAYTNYVAGLPPGSSSMQALSSYGTHPYGRSSSCSPGSSPGSLSPPLHHYAPPPPPAHWQPPISFLDSLPTPKFRPSVISVEDEVKRLRSHRHSFHPYSTAPMQSLYANQVSPESVAFPRFSFPSKPAAITKPLLASTAAAAADVAPASSPQVRPFKAIAKDPMSLVMNSTLLFDQHTHQEFLEFREKSLAKIKRTGDNSKMSRSGSSSSSGNGGDHNNNNNNNNSQSAEVTSNNESKIEERDATYLEKRKKNNEAAKKSRDARKMREDELAIWAEFMKLQNVRLMNRVAFLEEALGQMQMTVQQQAQQLLRLQRRESPVRVKSSSLLSPPIEPVA
ncbi:uncharacterized protein DDB_G0275275 [Trichogramma pretiosum]|uniref:uncharacterized protein DDB_G0275275 n=1 Tax=Trichogramma pretiosum TaxID=7493 RepID=UPI0006C9D7C0|nr:uncharacterized protein DDB_G0275275 [Trichogramma pretiosum]